MRKSNLFTSIALLVLLLILPLKVNAASLLSKLEVEGIGALNLARGTYNLTLTTTLDYANIMATPAKEGVEITGTGKINVNAGDNQIVVTATDGTETQNYTINLNVIKAGSTANAKSEGDGTPIANPKTGSLLTKETVITILLAFLISGLLIRNKRKVYKLN